MKSALTVKHPRPHWGALAFAAGLALSAQGSLAAAATASVTYIQVCANGVDANSGGCLVNPNSTAFVYSPDPGSQSWNLIANGLSGSSSNVNSFSPPSGSLSESAQTAGVTAKANSYDAGIDPVTQQPLLPTFGVSAEVTSALGGQALSNFVLSGSFCLADGDFACNAAGELTFTIFYDLLADVGTGQNAEASVDVFATGGSQNADFGDSTSGGSKSGSFTFTYALLAGERANLDIRANALAIPEPAGLALAMMGLVAVGASRRRRGAAQAR